MADAQRQFINCPGTGRLRDFLRLPMVVLELPGRSEPWTGQEGCDRPGGNKMNESERAIQQLVYGVLELAEATRMTAAEGPHESGRVEDLASKAGAVARQVDSLRALVQAEVSCEAPPAPLPRAEEIVESLDDIFGGL